jgi:Ribbon-helix-helix protein, copG family
MRTTLTLEDDVAAAVEHLRRSEGIGVSDAVNRLVRAGLLGERPRTVYVHNSRPLGMKVDVTNIGEVLEILDQS